jgi:hypothetical protein
MGMSVLRCVPASAPAERLRAPLEQNRVMSGSQLASAFGHQDGIDLGPFLTVRRRCVWTVPTWIPRPAATSRYPTASSGRHISATATQAWPSGSSIRSRARTDASSQITASWPLDALTVADQLTTLSEALFGHLRGGMSLRTEKRQAATPGAPECQTASAGITFFSRETGAGSPATRRVSSLPLSAVRPVIRTFVISSNDLALRSGAGPGTPASRRGRCQGRCQRSCDNSFRD